MYLGRRRIQRGDGADWLTGRRLLQNRLVDAVVLENGPRMIANEGLAYDRCQVGIVTGIDPAAALPANYIVTPDQMVKLLRTQIDVVLKTGAAVLNAGDARAVEMAAYCDGEVIYFAVDPALPVIEAHRAAGGRAVLIDDGSLVIAHGARRDPILALDARGGNSGSGGGGRPAERRTLARRHRRREPARGHRGRLRDESAHRPDRDRDQHLRSRLPRSRLTARTPAMIQRTTWM